MREQVLFCNANIVYLLKINTMDVYLTYDLSRSHSEVRDKLINDKSYKNRWAKDGKTYHLPNTCLWKKDVPDLNTPITDLNNVVNEVNRGLPVNQRISVKRCIVVKAYPWDGIEGTDERP